jgi:predicted nucleic acid-binding protein
MICVDQTFLVDLWRTRDLFDSPVRDFLVAHLDEEFVVPAHAAGGFLQCAAAISPERLEQAQAILRLFRIGEVGIETAHRYAVMVAQLRRGSELSGRSKSDLWIAAWAIQHAVPLVTCDKRHFRDIPNLELISYDHG